MSKKMKISYFILIVLFVSSLSFLGYKIYKLPKNVSNERQAVFLTNGQVYFGDIESVDKNFLTLKNIYYLKEQSKLVPNETVDDKKISIIKLGEELHGPEDMMYINRDQILFYENMRNNSKINDAIKKYLEQK